MKKTEWKNYSTKEKGKGTENKYTGQRSNNREENNQRYTLEICSQIECLWVIIINDCKEEKETMKKSQNEAKK